MEFPPNEFPKIFESPFEKSEVFSTFPSAYGFFQVYPNRFEHCAYFRKIGICRRRLSARLIADFCRFPRNFHSRSALSKTGHAMSWQITWQNAESRAERPVPRAVQTPFWSRECETNRHVWTPPWLRRQAESFRSCRKWQVCHFRQASGIPPATARGRRQRPRRKTQSRRGALWQSWSSGWPDWFPDQSRRSAPGRSSAPERVDGARTTGFSPYFHLLSFFGQWRETEENLETFCNPVSARIKALRCFPEELEPLLKSWVGQNYLNDGEIDVCFSIPPFFFEIPLQCHKLQHPPRMKKGVTKLASYVTTPTMSKRWVRWK